MRTVLRRLSRRIAAVIADCRYAQRRIAQLQMNPEEHLLNRDEAPATYREFLYRTSGVLIHEPPAARRSPGHAIR